MEKGVESHRKTVSIILLSLLAISALALVYKVQPAKASGTVGVKAGDWIKYTYTISGWPSGTPYPEWLKVEFLSVEGTNATIRMTMWMSDGTEQSDTMTVDVAAGGGTFQGLSGFVIPANCTTGGSIYITGYGNVTIAGETTRTYAGASRTVVYASFSQYGTQLTYYWDKQTGVMVEASVTSGDMSATAKATETNMWQAETIYIRADGSIDPPTAPISTVDNVTYTFTGNIHAEVVVERDNIIVDGNGYILQGAGSGNGFYLSGINNVTIQNTSIRGFDYGVYLNSTSYTVLSGNTIGNNDGGIYLYDCSNNVISGNDLIGNEYKGGILLGYCLNNSIFSNNVISNINWGIELYNSSNNNISDNNIRYNIYGSALSLYKSFDNRISRNNIVANYGYGIGLHSSSNNTLRTNSMAWNSPNFGVTGEVISDLVNDVDTSNTVDGKPIYYWVSKSDLFMPLDAGYIALVNCTRITVQNLNLTIDNLHGVLLVNTTNSTIIKNNITNSFIGVEIFWQSSNNSIFENNIANTGYGMGIVFSSSENIISGNNITNSQYGGIQIDESSNYNSIVGNNIVVSGSNGIYLGHFSNNNIVSRNNIANHSYYGGITFWNSSNNIIIENNIANNKYSGISLSNSSNNIFYHNNFINNTRQVYEWSQESPEISPSINSWDDGYPSGGNYWSNYEEWYPHASEMDGSGIWDTPYLVDGNNQDNYPLMNPYGSARAMATIDIDPDVLNLKGKLKWVNAYIELPEGYNVSDVDVSTLRLNMTIPAELEPTAIGDYDNDTIPDLMVEFNRTAVSELALSKGITYGNVTLTVTGKLYDGTLFEGSDVIKVRMPGDINCDGKVDAKDVALVSFAFGSYPGHPRWKLIADENEDGKIDVRDISLIARNFGKTYT